jgi:putative transposase
MNNPLHPTALFRLMVLGSLASRGELKRGEVSRIIRSLAVDHYNIPDSRRTHISEETIIRWYGLWKKGGIDALHPKLRSDKGRTVLPEAVQARIIFLKKDNPARSINTLIDMIEREGLVAKKSLARASVHRFLQRQRLSKRIVPDAHTIERRSFVAEHAGDIWQGDVLHGPCIQTPLGMRKTYLVSLLDDASRLIVHSAFCLGETALDIEGVLKQALLKRGLPHKLLIDNGAAYRSGSLQAICARLDIRLVYCRPGEPQGKGKLERYHSTFRRLFLSEINLEAISGLGDFNARLWAWLDQVYHTRPHDGLDGQSPIACWREGLVHVRSLTPAIASKIDDIFYHRIQRRVRKDGTINWEGKRFEVDHHQVDEKVILVFDPHSGKPIRIETTSGKDLGTAVLLDLNANLHRKRQRPRPTKAGTKQREYAVDTVHDSYLKTIQLTDKE